MGLRKPTFFRRIRAGVLTLACVLFFPFAFTMAADDGTLRIVAFGDSLTQGYGLPPNQAFPVQLEAALRTKGVLAAVFNAGVSGETSEDGLARIHHVLAVQPQIVILEFGANDVFAQFEPEETYVNLDRILTILRAKKIRVLLAGSRVPSVAGPEYDEEFNAIFPRLAEKHGVPLYPFFLEGVAGNAELNTSDGIHPNAEGIAVVVERILPHVLRLVESRPVNPP